MSVCKRRMPSRMPRSIGLSLGGIASWLMGGLLGLMIFLSIALIAGLFILDRKALSCRSSVAGPTSTSGGHAEH